MNCNVTTVPGEISIVLTVKSAPDPLKPIESEINLPLDIEASVPDELVPPPKINHPSVPLCVAVTVLIFEENLLLVRVIDTPVALIIIPLIAVKKYALENGTLFGKIAIFVPLFGEYILANAAAILFFAS